MFCRTPKVFCRILRAFWFCRNLKVFCLILGRFVVCRIPKVLCPIPKAFCGLSYPILLKIPPRGVFRIPRALSVCRIPSVFVVSLGWFVLS